MVKANPTDTPATSKPHSRAKKNKKSVTLIEQEAESALVADWLKRIDSLISGIEPQLQIVEQEAGTGLTPLPTRRPAER